MQECGGGYLFLSKLYRSPKGENYIVKVRFNFGHAFYFKTITIESLTTSKFTAVNCLQFILGQKIQFLSL